MVEILEGTESSSERLYVSTIFGHAFWNTIIMPPEIWFSILLTPVPYSVVRNRDQTTRTVGAGTRYTALGSVKLAGLEQRWPHFRGWRPLLNLKKFRVFPYCTFIESLHFKMNVKNILFITIWVIIIIIIIIIVTGKAIPLQAWTGPKGSRWLRLPDF